MVLLLVASACLCCGSFLLANEAGIRRPHRLSGTLVLSLAVLVILSLATGAMRRYEAGALLLASIGYVLLAALTVWLLRRRQPSSGPADAASPAAPTVPARRVRSPGIGLVANSVFGLLLLANAAEYAWRSVLAVLFQPLGYDPLYYHLINITQWVRHHALVSPFVDLAPGARDAGVLTQADSFPKNAELVGGWIAVFTQSMAGVGLTQILFVAMLGISATGVCRAVEIRADLARIAGALTCLCPAVVSQSDQLYVDIARVAPIVAAFQFVLVAYPAGPGSRGSRIEGRPVPLVLAGLALGFAVGVKSSNLLFLIVIPIVAILLTYARVRRENLLPERSIAESSHGLRNSLALLLAPAGAIGSYWYLRSWISWGSPFWPYAAGPFGGRSSFSGAYEAILKTSYHTDSAFLALLKSWWAATTLYSGQIRGDEFVGGLGLLWLVAGIPAVLLLLFHSYWNRRAALAVVLPLLLGTLLSPAAYNTRYSIPLAVCGVVAMAAVLDAGIAGRWRKAEPTVPSDAGGRPPSGGHSRRPTALGLTGFTAIATVISVLAISDAWAATRIGNWPSSAATLAPSLRLEIAAVRSPRTERARFGYLGEYADTMAELDPREPIAFFADETPLLTYPLLGPRLQRDLVVLPAPATLASARLARRNGLRYLYLGLTSTLIAKLPAQHAKLVGPVFAGFIFDLSPPPVSYKAALPNKTEVSAALPGASVTGRSATAASVLAAAWPLLTGDCIENGVGTEALTWAARAPYGLAAAACQFTDDHTPDSLAREIIDRLNKSGYGLQYNSESRLTQVYEKQTRGHLEAVIIVRLVNRIEVIKVTTSLTSHKALVGMAINVTKRFNAIR